MARLRVDRGAIVENWRRLCQFVGPDTLVAAVVKADAYGLGAGPVVSALLRAGCRWFFVMTPAEALDLVGLVAGSSARIAVLGGVDHAHVADYLAAPALVPVLNDLDQTALWRAAAPGRAAILHLDTGMSRYGIRAEDFDQLIRRPDLLEGLRLVAVMSHLACADDPTHPLNPTQRRRLLDAAAGLPAATLSLAASFGIYLGAEYHLGMVRAGAALYGINPMPGHANPMRNVVTLTAPIVQVADVAPGRTIGYGAGAGGAQTRRVATLGIGYADGIPRAGSDRAHAVIAGIKAPFVGRVSMDLVTVDVTHLPLDAVRVGHAAELIGPDQSIDDFARECDTVAYEILTRLGRRLDRDDRETEA